MDIVSYSLLVLATLSIFVLIVLKEVARNRGVYGIYFNNELMYVGKSKDVAKRLIRHRGDMIRNKHHNTQLQAEYNRLRNPSLQVKYKVLADGILFNLSEMEVELIKKLKPKCNVQHNN